MSEQTPTTNEQAPTETHTDPNANSEAAKWRTKLREAEAELEQARQELHHYHLNDLLEKVSTEWKVPKEFLQGESEEELTASAQRLVAFQEATRKLPASTSSDDAGPRGIPIGGYDDGYATTWTQAFNPQLH
jgi:hypothetical protein